MDILAVQKAQRICVQSLKLDTWIQIPAATCVLKDQTLMRLKIRE